MATEQIQIRLKHGKVRATDNQKDNLRGLGLRRREQVVIREDTPAVRGMIRRVIHLLEVSRPTKVKVDPRAGVAVVFKDGKGTPPKKKVAAKKVTKKKVGAKKVSTKKSAAKKA